MIGSVAGAITDVRPHILFPVLSPRASQGQLLAADEPIARAPVIGQTLWTLSQVGLMASDLATLQPESWLSLI